MYRGGGGGGGERESGFQVWDACILVWWVCCGCECAVVLTETSACFFLCFVALLLEGLFVFRKPQQQPPPPPPHQQQPQPQMHATTPPPPPPPSPQPPPLQPPPQQVPANANLYFCAQSLFKFHVYFDEALKGILQRDRDGSCAGVCVPSIFFALRVPSRSIFHDGNNNNYNNYNYYNYNYNTNDDDDDDDDDDTHRLRGAPAWAPPFVAVAAAAAAARLPGRLAPLADPLPPTDEKRPPHAAPRGCHAHARPVPLRGRGHLDGGALPALSVRCVR
jgi:hypothetical protein